MEINRNESDRQKALNMALLSIEKQFGKGSIMKLGDGKKLSMDLGVIPTGSPSLDIALGIGGLPRGRITEIYGPESSGKTTIALYAVAQVQREGGVAAFIDAEHALDVTYAKKLGVNTDDLLISQPDTGEQALEICEILVRSGGVDIVVISAGNARRGTVAETSDADYDFQSKLLMQAYFSAMRQGSRIMLEQGTGGSMVVVASKNGVAAGQNAAIYSAAKAFELHLMRCTAADLAKQRDQSGRGPGGLGHLERPMAHRDGEASRHRARSASRSLSQANFAWRND
jgi:protein RecA